VRQRLQQKFIDHFPDDRYELHVVYEAASYVLLTGTASSALARPQSAPNHSTLTNIPGPTAVQLDVLAAAITSLGEMFQNVLQVQQTGAIATSASGDGVCTFCGGTGHFLRECGVVAHIWHLPSTPRASSSIPRQSTVLPQLCCLYLQSARARSTVLPPSEQVYPEP